MHVCIKVCLCCAGLPEADGGALSSPAGREVDSGGPGAEGEPGAAGQSPGQRPHPGPRPAQRQAARVWRWASEKHGTISVTPPAAGSDHVGWSIGLWWCCSYWSNRINHWELPSVCGSVCVILTLNNFCKITSNTTD